MIDLCPIKWRKVQKMSIETREILDLAEVSFTG